MLKNIQFTDIYNMTCVYCRVEDKFSVCIKTTPSCIQIKKLKLFFGVFLSLCIKTTPSCIQIKRLKLFFCV